MTKLKEDRFDALMSKAQEQDAKAQYKLAQWFYNGHLVEKSNEQAAYWAFKSLNNGYLDAEKILSVIKY
jgi:TPR repeat protein